MALWEVKIPVVGAKADALTDLLAELEMVSWHLYVEPSAEDAFLTGFFETDAAAERGWEGLRNLVPPEFFSAEPQTIQVEDRDWKNAYRDHFKAWRFGGLHWVPVWEKERFSPPPGEEVVWLDPGMAFGTGNHETTRLCVERMVAFRDALREAGRPLEEVEVLDVGCGSGILAISAAKLGFGLVGGFDIDPEAVGISSENVLLNDLVGRVRLFQADVVTGLLNRTADLIVANIQADILCRHVSELVESVKPGGSLVLSGILASELEGVRSCFLEESELGTADSRVLGEWADLLLRL